MRVVGLVVVVGWTAFWRYWARCRLLDEAGGRVRWSRAVRVRMVLVVVVIALVRLGVVQPGAFRHESLRTGPWEAVAGLVLLAHGLGFAVWARVHIGRNWGTPMTQKTEPELVTSGPYRLVRNPIYSGIIVAGVGTAVALNWLWLIIVALPASYFIYSAIVEERYLAEQFPEAYPGLQALDPDVPPVYLPSRRRPD
ncbi:methyltransferase family protein [Leekyejoonella antrihumi]|uniref:Isoprenylcysteine carboxylmethyltransferase family protein n=1 Tax=Leekyejoonella antrihumi TaxID=1660198 RepID=A0A563DX71_9MICO|nr:isoprenylcysteine carboxylmethyltransferase family protein [Leekyejoonella antrihumi]TWP34571.1 isoprenylcysteine carboxylmethyltransferase family protein [Leekyejoonella antrihumi]